MLLQSWKRWIFKAKLVRAEPEFISYFLGSFAYKQWDVQKGKYFVSRKEVTFDDLKDCPVAFGFDENGNKGLQLRL